MSRLKVELHPLLTQSVIDALFSKNICTTLTFVQTELKQIAVITNLPYKDILTIRNHLINKHSAVVQNGLNYYNEIIQKTAILSTGIKNIDAMLQGGLTTGNIYEVCSLPGGGKTQFCLTIAKNIVPNLNQYVYYIDTKGDFSGKKIKTMLEAAKVSETNIGHIMSKILVKQISTSYQLINCLYEIKKDLENQFGLRLIIIDSLPALFYQSTNCAENYGIMNQCVNILRFLAQEFHIVFVVTNAVTTWYEGDFTEEKQLKEKLGLGKYWLGIPNVRIMVKQLPEGGQYEFVVLKTCTFPKHKKCIVSVNSSGMI